MGVLLALGSAACYGVADFLGGLLSRRAHSASIAFAGQAGGLVLTLVAAPLVPASAVTLPDLGWGALSGIGTGLGMMFLYRGLGHGDMSVVVPLSAVGGLGIPVVVGVLLGERPSAIAWIGIVVAVPALWLVSRSESRTGTTTAAGTLDALAASAGIALQYLALAQADSDAGLWPVVTGRFAAAATILPLAMLIGAHVLLGPSLSLQAALVGGGAALALFLYFLATRYQLLAIAVVLSSLYPAIPVLLGITVLRERLTRWQSAGLVLAGTAIGLLAAG
jgi:drug/metabolite transporter (DMT)-like permease